MTSSEFDLARILRDRQSLASIGIQELAAEINDGEDALLKLPAFQRDAVWDEDRLSRLWDSLFRGFPIGSLLLCPAENFAESNLRIRSLQSSVRDSAHSSRALTGQEVFILDGQQRSIAVSLGFRDTRVGAIERLWVDIGEADHGESDLAFYVTTTLRPWGGTIPYDHPKEIEMLEPLGFSNRHAFQQDSGSMLLRSFPLAAKLPVPVAEWLAHASEADPFDPLQIEHLHPSLRSRYVENVEALRARLSSLTRAIQVLREARIPIHIVYNLSNIGDLNTAFNRLNSQGVVMGPDELFYSALKMKWPEFHDMVWTVFANREFGRLMTPLRIVHLSLRLAMAATSGSAAESLIGNDEEQEEEEEPADRAPDVVALNSKQYNRIFTGDQHDIDQVIAQLRAVYAGHHRKGPFTESLIQCRNAILYAPDKGGDDPGLPIPLVARLDWHYWHVACACVYGKDISPDLVRNDLIRLALYMHFFFGRGGHRARESLVRAIFRVARSAPAKTEGMFEAIYDAVLKRTNDEERIGFQVLSTEQYATGLRPVGDSVFSEMLKSSGDALLYVQRSWINRWYGGYDPAAFQLRREDTPYDLDHIVPSASVNMRGIRDIPRAFWDDVTMRYLLQGSIGNLRVWPKELNRSDQDLAPGDKLRFEGRHLSVKRRLQWYRLCDDDDLANASHIATDTVEGWKNISTNKHDWFEEENRERFKALVVQRAERIFSDLVGPTRLNELAGMLK
ncbi:MAG: DUF262 domain-containing protein [Spirochaetales bacterium]|nr:DUF262 domain-containing protein [Leptospiraceae bacterium]MCP5483065.1 DUF262 domain-containing protein [Spirochaetales bacterium]MCP5486127.1 DUF262 domain-containing protein [Spirochaetales bacterium]